MKSNDQLHYITKRITQKTFSFAKVVFLFCDFLQTFCKLLSTPSSHLIFKAFIQDCKSKCAGPLCGLKTWNLAEFPLKGLLTIEPSPTGRRELSLNAFSQTEPLSCQTLIKDVQSNAKKASVSIYHKARYILFGQSFQLSMLLENLTIVRNSSDFRTIIELNEALSTKRFSREKLVNFKNLPF